jgi:2'-5' RNA ligase
MGVKKYFIAIVLPAPHLQEVERIKLQLNTSFGLRGALRSPAHITLHRPFEWKHEKEDILLRTLDKFSFSKSTTVQLLNFSSFAPRVIYVHVVPDPVLNELHHELMRFVMRELKLLNEAQDLRGFHPHVTIAFRDLKKNVFPLVWEQFSDKSFSASFPLSGFTLLRLEEKWEPIRDFYPGPNP